MAPFKLKFRMGSGSRSISQEIEEPVQQPLLMRQSAVSGSNTTLSSDYNSMSTNNDQHNLLPNTFDEETGKNNTYTLHTHTNHGRLIAMCTKTNRKCTTIHLNQISKSFVIQIKFQTANCSIFMECRLWKPNYNEKYHWITLLSKHADISIEFNDFPKCKLNLVHLFWTPKNCISIKRLTFPLSKLFRINIWAIARVISHQILETKMFQSMMNKSVPLVSSFFCQIHHDPMKIW